ncbi:restriction endonuclease subunit S [Paenibacillus sp. KN14-4R]|uniref:restriction endonuclease subunit S n=1 Tax=Paenibacillus sp. KN14-4R TaxID=3445773 RepID=UPI003F9F3ED4
MHTNHHIPDHWRLASWGDVGAFHHGSAFPRSFQGDTTGSISFYKVGSLSEAGGDGFLPTAKDTLTEEARAELRVPLVPAHAVLFAKIGEAIKLNRRALLRTPACIDNNLMAFSCNPTYVHHRFVYYWSMTIDFYELSQASAVPSIRKMSLANLSIPIPPLDEQRVIIKQIESLLRNIQFASQAIYDVNALFTHKIQKQNIFHPYGTLTDRILRLALQGRLTHAILERN